MTVECVPHVLPTVAQKNASSSTIAGRLWYTTYTLSLLEQEAVFRCWAMRCQISSCLLHSVDVTSSPLLRPFGNVDHRRSWKCSFEQDQWRWILYKSWSVANTESASIVQLSILDVWAAWFPLGQGYFKRVHFRPGIIKYRKSSDCLEMDRRTSWFCRALCDVAAINVDSRHACLMRSWHKSNDATNQFDMLGAYVRSGYYNLKRSGLPYSQESSTTRCSMRLVIIERNKR